METIEQIKEDEGGYQAEVYLCTAGKLTWLYGRNIEDRPITGKEWYSLRVIIETGGNQIEWAESLFMNELRGLDVGFRRAGCDYWRKLPDEVRTVLLNMGYNMGLTRFNPSKWPNFFTAIKDRDWKLAAAHGRDSLWFFQVGHRSARLMKSLAAVKSD